MGDAQILAIEGVAGVGKSTVVDALTTKFDARPLSLPTSFRRLRDTIDLDGSNSAVTRLLYYLAASSHMAEEAHLGGSFILDRWLPSVLGMVEVTSSLSRDELIDLSEPIAYRLLRPDLTVVLVADPQIIRARLGTQKKEPYHSTDVHRRAARDDAFRARWGVAISHWSSRLGPTRLVDTSNMTEEDVADTVSELWEATMRDTAMGR